jgi:hypothetical protein
MRRLRKILSSSQAPTRLKVDGGGGNCAHDRCDARPIEFAAAAVVDGATMGKSAPPASFR